MMQKKLLERYEVRKGKEMLEKKRGGKEEGLEI
jgi:hypothetical protein